MRQGYKQRGKSELSSTVKSTHPLTGLKMIGKIHHLLFIPIAILPMGMFSYDV